jgi:hypothetical protein
VVSGIAASATILAAVDRKVRRDWIMAYSLSLVIGINNPAKKTPLRQLRSRKACGSYSLEYPLVKMMSRMVILTAMPN